MSITDLIDEEDDEHSPDFVEVSWANDETAERAAADDLPLLSCLDTINVDGLCFREAITPMGYIKVKEH